MLFKVDRITVLGRVVDDAVEHLIDKHVQLILLLKQHHCGVAEKPLQEVSRYQDRVVSVVQNSVTVCVYPVIGIEFARCKRDTYSEDYNW